MTTLNQIKKVLEEIAESHGVINDFGFGADYDRGLSTTTKYPLMYAEVQASSFDDKMLLMPFNIVLSDRVDKGANNETDVLSDMLTVAMDVRAMLNSPDNYNSFKVGTSGVLTPFRDSTDDETAGWVLEVTFELIDLKDRCNVPII